jgi:pimeloyl-ACP methyl ester carboxylesterase
MPRFKHAGQDLHYEIYGEGSRNLVLMPGLLFPSRMHEPLATALAGRGHRVITFDLLGHGESDRPPEMWNYSMPIFGSQALALLDHLRIDRAVIGGTSLGANATLEAAVQGPDRVQGMIVEMPVLDNALLGCALAFTPLLLSLTFGAPLVRLGARAARAIPRGTSHLSDMMLDWVSQDPKPSASLLQGLFFGRTAPPRTERRLMEQPALVLGHPRDPVHPFSDADMLVRELPAARMVEAGSILEMRLTPERLTNQIVAFVEECFESAPSSRRRPRTAAAAGRAASARRGTP